MPISSNFTTPQDFDKYVLMFTITLISQTVNIQKYDKTHKMHTHCIKETLAITKLHTLTYNNYMEQGQYFYS
jgi:hypothetical protein